MAAVDAEEALEAHAEAFQDAFAGVSETIENLIRNNTVAPQTFAEHVEAFLTAIDFEEPFIRALLSVHIVLLVTLWLLRKSHTAQTALFIVICVLIGSAEQLNRWASKNWRCDAFQACGRIASEPCLGADDFCVLLCPPGSLQRRTTSMSTASSPG
eukprot:scaffold183_cov249-Pinguiococcus_pyrenoidosus.AAC.22